MKKPAKYCLVWGLVLGVLSTAYNCTSKDEPIPMDRIVLQLKWIHQSQFAGFYLAEERGYYARERLRVEFLEGGPQVEVVASLLSGKADFSVVSSELVLKSRQKDKAPVTAIAAIYGKSAVVYAAKKISGILKPADFIGKSAAVQSLPESSGEFEYQFRAMVKRQGLDISRIKLLPYDPSYASFYSGEADITAAYFSAGVVHIRSKGYEINLIWPNDYGIHFYSDTLITTDRMVARNPDLVERFLRASLLGWRDAVGDPEAAVTATLKYARIKDRKLQIDMMTALIPLVHSGRDPIGWMQADVWRLMHRVMVDQKILDQPLADPTQAYTMEFLERIYGPRENEE